MNYKVDTVPNFEKEAKKLTKKYKSLKSELIALVEQLENNPTQGIPLGNNIYKVRLSITSKGKSGGARVITCVKVLHKTVYLVSIYDKSQLQNLSKEQISELLKKVGLV